MSGAETALAPGFRFGPFLIERLLGRGGMGEVYLCRDARRHEPVVLKLLLPRYAGNVGVLERFHREAVATSRITSWSVVRVYDAGEFDQRPYIAFEYVEGKAASDLRKAYGKLPPPLAAAITLGVAMGLRASHAVGVIHRDVKPHNVLIGRNGVVKLADFGIARFFATGAHQPLPELTVPGSVLGTPFYVAPEQGQGKPIDGRADVYALGVSFYELLTGSVPFVGRNHIETIAARLQQPPRPPRALDPKIPVEYERACLAMLAVAPEQRPNSEQVVAMLQPLVPPDAAAGIARLVGAGEVAVSGSTQEFLAKPEREERPVIPPPAPAVAPLDPTLLGPAPRGRRDLYLAIGALVLLLVAVGVALVIVMR